MEMPSVISLNSFNRMNAYNDVFKKSQSDMKTFKVGIEENINNNELLKNDKELSDDLKLLLGKNPNAGAGAVQGTSSAQNLFETFGGALEKSIHSLNGTQVASEKAFETFATGGNIDVHQVMMASRKAGLSMELAMKMQNKIIQAYQEISHMQV